MLKMYNLHSKWSLQIKSVLHKLKSLLQIFKKMYKRNFKAWLNFHIRAFDPTWKVKLLWLLLLFLPMLEKFTIFCRSYTRRAKRGDNFFRNLKASAKSEICNIFIFCRSPRKVCFTRIREKKGGKENFHYEFFSFFPSFLRSNKFVFPKYVPDIFIYLPEKKEKKTFFFEIKI